jgi:hypothetical protein
MFSATYLRGVVPYLKARCGAPGSSFSDLNSGVFIAFGIVYLPGRGFALAICGLAERVAILFRV